MAFLEGFAAASLVDAFQGGTSFKEAHLDVLLEKVNLAGFQDQRGRLRVFRLRAEAVRPRVKKHKKVIVAAVHAHPFAVYGEFGLDLVAHHGGPNDVNESFVLRDAWFRMSTLICFVLKVFTCVAAGRFGSRLGGGLLHGSLL